ncbi:hypothetical protein [Shinella sp.]|uniref:hypothetical protein n=2 Tax=Rhizobiaceae TaxID=82115 RepID=UPI0028979DEE|nr:hypothetical protein [Shinella sp.]
MAATKPKADAKKSPTVRTWRFRKLTLVLTGAVLLSGTSASLAVYLKPELVFRNAEPVSVSGVACTIVRTIKVRKNGQRWVRQHIKVASTDEAGRIATGLRIVGLLSKSEEADLYQVVVMDSAAPEERAAVRGGVKGVDVLFAPDPTKVDGLGAAFNVTYREGFANTVGVYNGQLRSLSTEQIKTVMLTISEPAPCVDPEMPVSATSAEETQTAKASNDGEEASADIGADEIVEEEAASTQPED